MITLLTGENSFEIQRALDAIVADFKGVPERLDGSEMTIGQLPDLMTGTTLFAEKRLIIVKALSENKSVWEGFGEWCKKLSDDIHLVLVDQKPDKRTRTYKELQKLADVQEYKLWGERDQASAEHWLTNEAKKQGWELNKKCAQVLVSRVGNDQWALMNALNKLAVLDDITPETIEQVIEAQPSENVFNLFEAALGGNSARVHSMIKTLELSEDPYMVFGLLSGQVFQLAVLTMGKEGSDVAKDVGVHPFALNKLSPYAKTIGRPGVKKIVMAFTAADDAMKTSAVEPWLLIERALVKVVVLK